MLDNLACIWPLFGVLLLVGFVIDQAFADRPQKWGDETASEDAVERILAGKQREEPRHLAKMVALLAFVGLLIYWLAGVK